jgi:DNA processing protein
LHVRGTVADAETVVAIVGARAASARGMTTAFELAFALGGRRSMIVSGGAIGIDGAAHRGAIDAGAATLAVLGCGVDVTYPARHRGLFERIVVGGGGLVSTYADGTPPLGYQFVARNAVIAGLADAVVVVEASANSGSLHTARSAARIGRIVAAVPGTTGTDALLAAGASLVETADDVIAALAGTPRRIRAGAIDDRAARVLGAIDGIVSDDELAARTGLDTRAVACALFDLEAAGLVVALPGSRFRTTPLAAEAR